MVLEHVLRFLGVLGLGTYVRSTVSSNRSEPRLLIG